MGLIVASYICYSQDWKLATGFPSDFCVYSISYEEDTAYAIGFTPLSGKGTSIYSSDDKGGSWTAMCTIPEVSANYILVNKGRIIISGYAYENYIMCYSDDKGKSWNPVSGIGSDKLFSSIICHKNNLISICGTPAQYVSYISKDNGQSWEQYFTLPSECNFVSGIASCNNSIVAVMYSESGFGIMNSIDDGKNWRLSSLEGTFQSIAGVCSYGSNIYAAGQLSDMSNILCISKDSGKTFTSVDTFPKDILMIHSISAVDTRLFIVATSSNGETFVCYKDL